jgi:5-oxoprolinase (ATP-hydrolysing) subunit A
MDLNCDMGESFGLWPMGDDEKIMPYITSANIACGLHAGDPLVMKKTVQMAASAGVAVGAHPGYADLQGFGRRSIPMSREEIIGLIVYQLGALEGFCRLHGTRLHHVKPHGALYNTGAVDPTVAEAIAMGVVAYNPELILVGLAGSLLLSAGREQGLVTAGEAFADRHYKEDGTLVPRSHPQSVLHDPDAVAERVLEMVRTRRVQTLSGAMLDLDFATICLHGDTPGAVAMAARIHGLLRENDVELAPLSAQY